MHCSVAPYGYLSTLSVYRLKDNFSKYMAIQIPWLDVLSFVSCTVMIVVPLIAMSMASYFKSKLKS